MGFRDQDVREGLVVAQQHVVARLELLDEVLFQQQRLCFGARGQEHHRTGFADHPRDARRMARRPGIVRHPRPQIPRLADIQNAALGIQHPVDAGAAVQLPQIVLDQRMAGLGGGALCHICQIGDSRHGLQVPGCDYKGKAVHRHCG